MIDNGQSEPQSDVRSPVATPRKRLLSAMTESRFCLDTMEKAMRMRMDVVERWGTVRRKKAARKKKRLEAGESLLDMIPHVNSQPSEFEVQMFLCNSLNSLGYVARGEVMAKCRTCRFDIVVYKDSMPVRIIEVKKQKVRKKRTSVFTDPKSVIREQVERYKHYGLGVDLVCGMNDAKKYIKRVEKRPFKASVGSTVANEPEPVRSDLQSMADSKTTPLGESEVQR